MNPIPPWGLLSVVNNTTMSLVRCLLLTPLLQYSTALILNANLAKSRLPFTCFLVVRLFCYFVQSTTVSSPCSVQNFKTIWQLKLVLWTRWIDLTHSGRVTHICVGNLTIIGSDNGLSPGRRQAITWTNVGILLIGPLGTHFSEMLIEIHTFSFKKIHLKMSSGKWRPFCLGLSVLSYRIL